METIFTADPINRLSQEQARIAIEQTMANRGGNIALGEFGVASPVQPLFAASARSWSPYLAQGMHFSPVQVALQNQLAAQIHANQLLCQLLGIYSGLLGVGQVGPVPVAHQQTTGLSPFYQPQTGFATQHLQHTPYSFYQPPLTPYGSIQRTW